MKIMLLLSTILIFEVMGAVKAVAPGVIDGNQKSEQAGRMGAAWYDWRLLVPAAITSDTIKFDSLYGKGTIVRQVTNITHTDGRFIGITSVGTKAPYPALSNQATGILPSITKMLKAGTTIDTMVLFIQVYGDTTNR